MSTELPLQGLRILELADGQGESCGRLLADLGADVVMIEPFEGSPARKQAPLFEGVSLYFETHAANKQSLCLDLNSGEGRQQFATLCSQSDILVEARRFDDAAERQTELKVLREQFPKLIILSLSDFGLTGPYANYRGSNALYLALAGVLARSGIEGERPLLPPGDLACEATAIQAAWVTLLAYWQRLHTHQGNLLDFSVFEATAQILDPGLGVTGSGAAGRSATEIAPYGRPPVGKIYPIFPCADGYVRICILNPRQWRGMCGWLGDDHPFTDPAYEYIGKRYKVIEEINALIADLFSQQKAEALVAEGQRRGVPIAAVATPAQVFSDKHFQARGAFTPIEVNGKQALTPSGYLEINDRRIGLRSRAPECGGNSDLPVHWRQASRSEGLEESSAKAADRRPLSGLRILDLGVIVAGAELGRIFADQGAEVIKVENKAFPDGLRQSSRKVPISQSFAQGSRNKLSFGLNLRDPEGLSYFKELVKQSDAVFTNFKPGTLESLGIGYETLKALNPGIVLVESSALGHTGPLAKSMGYGPLVRAASGLTGLWRYPELDDSYSDSITIFPDHFVARLAGTAVLSALIERRRTGVGARICVSQAEAILNTLATQFTRESLQNGTLKPLGNIGEFNAPSNIYPCAGDDLWCVIDVQTDEQWRALCLAMGRDDLAADEMLTSAEGRIAQREQIDQAVSAWTGTQDPNAIMETLQGKGIPAAAMQRLTEFDENPHFQRRGFFRHFVQPGFPETLQTENGPVSFSELPEPVINPAPFQGQHTRELASRLLRLGEKEIDVLVEKGVLETIEEDYKELVNAD